MKVRSVDVGRVWEADTILFVILREFFFPLSRETMAAHCFQEVIVSGSSEDECVHLWDMSTATTLVSYRPAAPGSAAAVTPIGRDYLAVSQNAKASLHVFQVCA
jgi:hypothetical protein